MNHGSNHAVIDAEKTFSPVQPLNHTAIAMLVTLNL